MSDLAVKDGIIRVRTHKATEYFLASSIIKISYMEGFDSTLINIYGLKDSIRVQGNHLSKLKEILKIKVDRGRFS